MSNIWEKENDVGNNSKYLKDGKGNFLCISGKRILVKHGEKEYKKSNWSKE